MKRLLALLGITLTLLTASAAAEETAAYRLEDERGLLLAWLDVPPAVDDVLLTRENTRYRVVAVQENRAVLREDGTETLPDVPWRALETAQGVSSAVRTIGLLGEEALVRPLLDALTSRGAAVVSEGAEQADFPLTLAQDEISDAAEYDTLLTGEKAASVRLLVRRGGDNEDLLRNFALSVKSSLQHSAPTLLRDVYFSANLPEDMRLLLGARATEGERLQAGISPLAQALSDALHTPQTAGGLGGGEALPSHSAVTGVIFAGGLLLAGVVGYGLLLTSAHRQGKSGKSGESGE